MRVLVADDDPVTRRLLQVTLEHWGHEVVLAEDGVAALAALRADDRPRLAILDWMMPEMTGPEVCSQLRTEPDLRGTYVILLTARGKREDAVMGLSGGADDFMTKPFDREMLRARIAVGERMLALQQDLTDSNARLQEHGDRLEDAVAKRTSELELAHRDLTAAGHLKDRILSCVHHELRTPVTKLLAVGQCLERVREGTAPPPGMLATLVQQSRHLAGLLDQVLSARALMGGGDSPSDGPTAHADLISTVEAVAFWSQEIAAACQVRIEVAPNWPATLVAAEASALTLVLGPLVENAVKFTRPGSTVRVGFAAAGAERVRVTVTDEGTGVRPEDFARIFAEFDQGSADPLVAKPKGLGLGLSIARRLARRLGGEVGLEPSAPGQGATFWVELPLALEIASSGTSR